MCQRNAGSLRTLLHKDDGIRGRQQVPYSPLRTALHSVGIMAACVLRDSQRTADKLSGLITEHMLVYDRTKPHDRTHYPFIITNAVG